MLSLLNITKSYTTGEFTQTALDGVTLHFRKNEFVAILGASGSGKTTCLNIIGGLDRYDGGDLIINGKSSKDFKSADWDAYRNNSIGFIFQSYNLIPHLSIIDNVEMGMTLSGVSREKRHKKALEVLDRVGLGQHLHKKPNQLSGGQMQRVAIARALANDPDIILADEPTGALDTKTSRQIMELIREIAKDKLVIMVTHNPELAEEYADRIVRFQDGQVTDDTAPFEGKDPNTGYALKKTGMSLFTALKLSGKNIATKKGRTILTAFASSIGIIGIALILSLSNGFQLQIDAFQRDALAEFPVIVSKQAVSMDRESMMEMREQMINAAKDEAPDDADGIQLYDPTESRILHQNRITEDYLSYIKAINPAICSSIGYTNMTGMNLLRKTDNGIQPVSVAVGMRQTGAAAGMSGSMSSMGLTSYPEPLDGESDSYLEKNYDLLAGTYPADETGLVLVVDKKNRLNVNVLKDLGFRVGNADSIRFDEVIGTKLRLIANDDFYQKTPLGGFVPNQDYAASYESDSSITLTITGIVRIKPDVTVGMLDAGIAYSDRLNDRIIAQNEKSAIVEAQKQADYNVITMEALDEKTKDSTLTYLGAQVSPSMIYLYPEDFEQKEAVLSYLDAYNKGKAEEDVVVYTDLANTMTDMTGGIMDAITIVLIAFAGISLVVSLIMIGIITYISVLERTKEIGVLRALGARKKDIARVFNAETFIIGLCSGLLGISLAYLLTIPVNNIILNMTELENVAQLNPLHAFILVAVSVSLTLLGGLIPARFAARKDPVEALRTE